MATRSILPHLEHWLTTPSPKAVLEARKATEEIENTLEEIARLNLQTRGEDSLVPKLTIISNALPVAKKGLEQGYVVIRAIIAISEVLTGTSNSLQSLGDSSDGITRLIENQLQLPTSIYHKMQRGTGVWIYRESLRLLISILG